VSVALGQHEVRVHGILAENFISRPRPRTWDPRPRALSPRPRPLLFVLEAPRGWGQDLEDTSLRMVSVVCGRYSCEPDSSLTDEHGDFCTSHDWGRVAEWRPEETDSWTARGISQPIIQSVSEDTFV